MFDVDLASYADAIGANKTYRKVRLIEHDDRGEDRDRVTSLVLKGLGYTVVQKRLPVGDWRWESRVGLFLIERKTEADFRDIDRLLPQLEKLRQAARYAGAFPVILIEHREGFDPRRWTDEHLDNALLSLQGLVRVAHCAQGELAQRIDSLYRWSQKASHRLLDTTYTGGSNEQA